MASNRTRFPKRHLWRVVDDIIGLCEELDPGDPDFLPDGVLDRRQYRYRENRHYDLEAVWDAALKLRDAIGSFR